MSERIETLVSIAPGELAELRADAARWRAARGLFEILDTKPFKKTVYWHADFVSDCDSIDEAIDVFIAKGKE